MSVSAMLRMAREREEAERSRKNKDTADQQVTGTAELQMARERAVDQVRTRQGVPGTTDEKAETATPLGTAMEEVAKFIPTEAITLYVAGLGLFASSGEPERWAVFGVAVAVIAVLTFVNHFPLEAFRKPSAHWRKWSVLTMALGAFCAWAFATPDGPFDKFGDTAAVWGAFAVLVLAGVLPLLAKRFSITS